MADPLMEDTWLDTKEAAAYSGKTVRVLNRLCRANPPKIQFGRDGQRGPYKFKKQFIDAYFMANGYDGRRRK